jgi:protein TonB
MRAASSTYAAYRAAPSWRDRLASVGLALALVGLLIWVLIRMGGMPFLPPGDGRPLSTFDVAIPGPKQEVSHPKQREREAKVTQTPAERPPVTPPPPPPVPLSELELPGVIKLSRNDYAAADIGRIPRAAPAPGGASGPPGNASGGAKGEAGAGPNGETLYAAEWVREPTRAELITFLPQRQQTGWGMIACRTVERNRVEDCREMGESLGSGIARGLRRASWQFLVRPPRVNGKPLIGAWVRIKYDLVVGAEK